MRTRREGGFLLVHDIDPPITREDLASAVAIPMQRLSDIVHIMEKGKSIKIDLKATGLVELIAITSFLALPWVPVAIDWFRVRMRARSPYAVGTILGRAASYIRDQLGIKLEELDNEHNNVEVEKEA